MSHRIVPSNVLMITKDGECKLNVTIDLNINLNNGTVGIAAVAPQVREETQQEDSLWEIPDFGDDAGILPNFGKQV